MHNRKKNGCICKVGFALVFLLLMLPNIHAEDIGESEVKIPWFMTSLDYTPNGLMIASITNALNLPDNDYNLLDFINPVYVPEFRKEELDDKKRNASDNQGSFRTSVYYE